MFKNLKTNGFNREDLRIEDKDKIRLLFSMVVLAYILAVLAGVEDRKKTRVRLKTYAKKSPFEEISCFKQGYYLLIKYCIKFALFLDFIQSLSCSFNCQKEVIAD
ncbi:MAG: hypothetical protein Fur004_27400 [Thermoflexibacter sp.]